jgi:hypothetical protein
MDDDRKRIEETKDRIVMLRWSAQFASLRIMQPTYSLASTFLVIERNSLRKLFDFASGHSRGDWRIVAEVVNKTLFLTRWERNQQSFLTGTCKPGDKAGYGHSFEDIFLQPEKNKQGSCAHHRIVEYEIGGMKWLVRFEADGYLGDQELSTDCVVLENAGQLENLSGCRDSMGLQVQTQTQIVEGIQVIQKGHLVPDASVIEAKCRNVNAKGRAKQTIEQCWFSQTKHVFVGREDHGVIREIKKTDMTATFDDWERDNQESLRRLVKVIEEIRCVVNNRGRCFVLHEKSGQPRALQFLKAGNRDALNFSEDLKKRHWG